MNNLSMWCKKFYEKKGIKVHAHSAPVNEILDDILGELSILRERQERIAKMQEEMGNVLLAITVEMKKRGDK